MPHRYATVAVITLLALMIGLGQESSLPPSGHTAIMSSPFPSLDPAVERAIGIPLRVPKILPQTGQAQLFPVVLEADSERYEIALAMALPCNGEHRCTYGTVQGSIHPIESWGKSTRVDLEDGIVGHFTPMECGAYCSEAYIMWRQGAYLYSIGIKAGSKKELLEAARSAIH